MKTNDSLPATLLLIVGLVGARTVHSGLDDEWADKLHSQFGVPLGSTLVSYSHPSAAEGTNQDPIIVYSEGHEVAWVFEMGSIGGVGMDLGDGTYQKLCDGAGEQYGHQGCVEALRSGLLKEVREAPPPRCTLSPN